MLLEGRDSLSSNTSVSMNQPFCAIDFTGSVVRGSWKFRREVQTSRSILPRRQLVSPTSQLENTLLLLSLPQVYPLESKEQ